MKKSKINQELESIINLMGEQVFLYEMLKLKMNFFLNKYKVKLLTLF